ncbi:MAG: FecR domain-containing protein [Sphingomonadaceae bacterium]|jgi:transmembrane sensor|nr:FecR domain-containing protein [Sphingomonadaceae bacterium]
MTNIAPKPADATVAEAADWYARLANESVREADFAAFRKWRAASPENAQAYDRLAELNGSLDQWHDVPEIVELRVAALAKQDRPGAFSRFTKVAASIALVAFAAMGVGFYWQGLDGDAGEAETVRIAASDPVASAPSASATVPEDEEGAEQAEAAAPLKTQYSTRIGEMASFTLPDGSVIELNTNSEVAVDYTGKLRSITLARGEALFRVAKDPSRAFVVGVGQDRVVALGTVFSVRKDSGKAQVTLLEGRVRVESIEQRGGNRIAQLSPGEELSILPQQPYSIRKADVATNTSWRTGRLRFKNEPLEDVLREMNRYSAEKFVLADPAVGRMSVSGTFRIQSAEHFSSAIEAALPVEIERKGNSLLVGSPASRHIEPTPDPGESLPTE